MEPLSKATQYIVHFGAIWMGVDLRGLSRTVRGETMDTDGIKPKRMTTKHIAPEQRSVGVSHNRTNNRQSPCIPPKSPQHAAPTYSSTRVGPHTMTQHRFLPCTNIRNQHRFLPCTNMVGSTMKTIKSILYVRDGMRIPTGDVI